MFPQKISSGLPDFASGILSNILVLVFFLSISLSLTSCSRDKASGNKKAQNKNTYSVTDDLNNKITFSRVPEKIISLAPNLTEFIYLLGEGDKLKGNTVYCTYPEEAKKVTKVGDMLTLDFERILSIKPDIILITVEGNALDSYNKLKELGLKVFVSNPRDFNGIKKTFTDLGVIFQKETLAIDSIKSWDKRYNAVIKNIGSLPRPKAMFLVGFNPIMVAGKHTFINGLISAAGLDNIAEDSHLNYPIFSREEILRRNPDYIITTDNRHGSAALFRESYPEWRSLRAVKEGRIIVADPDLYLRPGPRFITALEDLSERVHPRVR